MKYPSAPLTPKRQLWTDLEMTRMIAQCIIPKVLCRPRIVPINICAGQHSKPLQRLSLCGHFIEPEGHSIGDLCTADCFQMDEPVGTKENKRHSEK